MSRRALVDVAMGRSAADVVVQGGTVVNVHTGELLPGDVAIVQGRIAVVGDVSHTLSSETKVIEAGGAFVAPGLIDGHLHHCHSVLGVTEFAEALLTHGVTATADGFYGPGLVAGPDAVRFFKDAFDRLPIRLLFLVPVLAWSQNRELGLTPASAIGLDDMLEMLSLEDCHGLEEPPPLPVIESYPEMVQLLDETLRQRKVVTGHAAGLSGAALQAYAAAGATTDHESVDADEALERARAGIALLMRQGDPGCEDVPAVLRAHTDLGAPLEMFGFCSDLAAPEKVVQEGTMDHAVRVAIAEGVDPVAAITMATLGTARALRLDHELGAVAPGRHADLLILDELAGLTMRAVLAGGETVVEDGRLVAPLPRTDYPEWMSGSVRLARTMTADDFAVAAEGADGEVEVRLIGVSEQGSLLVSPEERARVQATKGVVEPDVAADVLPIAMIDRLGKGTGMAVALAHGFGLTRGAMASTLNALCMNAVVVGADADDMAIAVNELAARGGGRVVVDSGRIVAAVDMPVLGLHSDRPAEEVVLQARDVRRAAAELGSTLRDPFGQLEFCFACQDIGDLKLSEEGLVQVRPPRMVDVVVG